VSRVKLSIRQLPLVEVGAILLLLWALVPTNPYGYYLFLRVVMCAACCFLAMKSHMAGKPALMWTFIGLAALYNPFMRVPLTRLIWSIFNVATIAVLGYAAILFRPKKK
jgi:hypothetical protein